MNAINLEFICTAESKRDCRFWKVVTKKERCGNCDVYKRGDFDKSPECCVDYCPNYLPRCKYDDSGECRYTLPKVNRMVLEFKKMGVVVELKGEKK